MYRKGQSIGGGVGGSAAAATESKARTQRQAPSTWPSRYAGRPRHSTGSIRGAATGSGTSRHEVGEKANSRSTHRSHAHRPPIATTLYPCTLRTAPARAHATRKKKPYVTHKNAVRREGEEREENDRGSDLGEACWRRRRARRGW